MLNYFRLDQFSVSMAAKLSLQTRKNIKDNEPKMEAHVAKIAVCLCCSLRKIRWRVSDSKFVANHRCDF